MDRFMVSRIGDTNVYMVLAKDSDPLMFTVGAEPGVVFGFIVISGSFAPYSHTTFYSMVNDISICEREELAEAAKKDFFDL